MHTLLESTDSGRNRRPRDRPAGRLPLAATVLVLAVAACGGAPAGGSTAEPLDTARGEQAHAAGRSSHMGAGDDKAEADEMAAMPLSIVTFHDALAKRWHAPYGPRRMPDACAATAELTADANAIVAAAAPTGADAAVWSAGGKDLAAAVVNLDATCKANDAAAFERAFARVHEQFHGVMAASGGHHDSDKP